MTVSSTAFSIICIIIFVAISFPFLKSLIKKEAEKTKKRMVFIILACVVCGLIAASTPSLIIVTQCNEYKKEVLLFPKEGFTYGNKTYIVNNSESPLYLEYIEYGELKKEVPEDEIIDTEETYLLEGSLDYIFRESPKSVSVKSSDGVLKTALHCIELDSED